MKRLLQSQFMLAWLVALLTAFPASAQPLLRWSFDESDTGSQDALDTGLPPAEDGIFMGGATRTSNTPDGASTGAADLFVGEAGTNAFIQASDASNLDGLASLTQTIWLNLQADPVGNDRIVALQGPGTPFNADFDGDGEVDGSDFLTWQRHAGIDDGLALPEDGDANGDGNVLADDLGIWSNQFGGAPILHGAFAGFSLNMNLPNSGNPRTAGEFRLGMFIGGLDAFGDPAFDFGQSSVDVGADDAWLFIATTFDGVTGDMVFYTGTESEAVTQLGDSFTLLPVEIETTGLNFYVGNTDAASSSTSLEGFVDDVRIYDTALDLAALNAVRLENLAPGLTGVPEPTALVLSTLVALVGTIFRRRR